MAFSVGGAKVWPKTYGAWLKPNAVCVGKRLKRRPV